MGSFLRYPKIWNTVSVYWSFIVSHYRHWRTDRFGYHHRADGMDMGVLAFSLLGIAQATYLMSGLCASRKSLVEIST